MMIALSQSLPDIRFICPGGFVLNDSSAEEVIAIDKPGSTDVQSALDHLKRQPEVAEVELLESTSDKAFVRILTSANPGTGFCLEAVERNRCFPIGMEIQYGGVEHWKVGCYKRSQDDELLAQLARMGELQYQTISEASWQDVLERAAA